MIADPERYANEYELDAKASIDNKRESGSVSIVAMRIWLRAAHAVVELTGPADSNGKTFGSDGNISLWLHESDLALGNILLNRISKENAKLRKLVADMWHFTGAACKKYPRLFDPAAQGGQMVQLNMIDAFEQRMRELGVEAEE